MSIESAGFVPSEAVPPTEENKSEVKEERRSYDGGPVGGWGSPKIVSPDSGYYGTPRPVEGGHSSKSHEHVTVSNNSRPMERVGDSWSKFDASPEVFHSGESVDIVIQPKGEGEFSVIYSNEKTGEDKVVNAKTIEEARTKAQEMLDESGN